MRKYFVIDVESVGLHGEGFAVGGGLYLESGATQWEFRLCCPVDECLGAGADRKWVKENVPSLDITHHSPKSIREAFWLLWLRAKNENAIMVADCLWPVEAGFIADCIKDDPSRSNDGPYPFVDVGTMLLAAGLDPVGTFEREESEKPIHDPLADARQSARLLVWAFSIIDQGMRVSGDDDGRTSQP